MNHVKDNFKIASEFQPNLSLFNQNGTLLFGSLKLNEFSSKNSFENSQILTDLKQSFESIKLCEFSSNDKWSLLYRGTRDGFQGKDFHSKCNGHSNTLIILKANGTPYIFGVFTSIDWDSSGKWKSDPNAFLFSLTNKENKSMKMKIDPNHHHRAIY
jgi:hypothetical protein